MAAVRSKNGKLFIDYRVKGARKREYLKIDDTRENRKIAEIRRKEIEFELASGIHSEKLRRLDAKSKLLEDGFREFIRTKRHLRKSTLTHYQNAFDKFKKYSGNIKIKSFNQEMIGEIILCMKEEISGDNEDGKRISPNTVASYMTKIKVLFEYFKEQGYCENNPVPTQHMKPKKIDVLTDKEIETLLEKIKNPDRESLKESSLQHYRLIAMLLMTGLRVTECLNLSFDDIDFRDNLIRVRNEKTDRIDYLPLYKELREFIQEQWKTREGRLFTYSSRHSLNFFKRFLRKEGYPDYSFHTLRKTFISKLINSGMSVYDVMTLARHKDLKTTLKHYTAAELHRMGTQISEQTNLGSLLGPKHQKGLKLLKIS